MGEEEKYSFSSNAVQVLMENNNVDASAAKRLLELDMADHQQLYDQPLNQLLADLPMESVIVRWFGLLDLAIGFMVHDCAWLPQECNQTPVIDE